MSYLKDIQKIGRVLREQTSPPVVYNYQDTLYILANRNDTGEDFARRLGMQRGTFRVVTRPDQMHGLRGARYIKSSCFYLSRYLREIQDMVLCQQWKEEEQNGKSS